MAKSTKANKASSKKTSTKRSSKSKPSSPPNSISRTNPTQKGKLFVFTGTSGAGKTTIAQAILHEFDFFKRIVTCTTRPMRDGEKDGVDYHFLSKEKFLDYLAHGALLEHATVYGNYYGSLKEEVEEVINSGKSVLLVLDVQGALTIQSNFPAAEIIFIKTPSLTILKKRLILRGTDKMDVIDTRIKEATAELKLESKFSRILVNDDLQKAISEMKKLILQGLGK